jgi:hypothetical protein
LEALETAAVKMKILNQINKEKDVKSEYEEKEKDKENNTIINNKEKEKEKENII